MSQLLPTPPPGYGCTCRAFHDGHSLCFLWSQVTQSYTLPSAHPCRSAGQPGAEETGAVAAGEFPKVPPSVFFFLRKSSCSLLPLHTRKGLFSHTAHLSNETGDCPGPGPTWPNSQLSPVSTHSLCDFTTSSLFPSL